MNNLPNESDFSNYADKYADLEDELFGEKGGGGGGGKSKKNSPRDPKSKTAKAKKHETIEASKENRREEIGIDLKRVFNNFPKFDNEQKRNEFLEMYTAWVNASLVSGEPLVGEGDLQESFTRASGAGGQNVNKVSSAVQLRHIPTNIMVRNEESRSQEENRQKAREVLAQRLEEHLRDWKQYTEDSDEVDVSDIITQL